MMHMAVMGSGGVGAYCGARLVQSSHEMAFVARRRQLRALRAHGLQMESPLGHVAERRSRLGVPTSCNRAIFGILSLYSEGRAE
jgi:ketopantoate reductase